MAEDKLTPEETAKLESLMLDDDEFCEAIKGQRRSEDITDAIQRAVILKVLPIIYKQAEEELAKSQVCPKCAFCGEVMSKNPHPKAGKPNDFLTVGTEYVCIPCGCKTRYNWAERATKAEGQLAKVDECSSKATIPTNCGLCMFLKDDRGFDLTIHNWVCLSPACQGTGKRARPVKATPEIGTVEVEIEINPILDIEPREGKRYKLVARPDREKIEEIFCRACDGISHADTCELEKAECPVLKTAPDQILALMEGE